MSYNDYPCQFYTGNGNGYYNVATASSCPLNQLECSYSSGGNSGCNVPISADNCPVGYSGPHCELQTVCNEFPTSPMGPYF